MATFMSEKMDPKVYSILEHARITGERVRIWYGDTETGRDWLEEYDVIGNIGRSIGKKKIPLLIKNNRSLGGVAILTDCIVKITINKRIVYQHPNYKTPDFHIYEWFPVETRDNPDFKYTVRVNGNDHVTFKTRKQAENWKAFMLGQRNSK